MNSKLTIELANYYIAGYFIVGMKDLAAMKEVDILS